MYSQIASQTFHINKYKGEQSERTVREQNTNHRIRNTEYKTQNAIQEATLSAHNKCQWWGGHYKHKNVLPHKNFFKNFASRGEIVGRV